MVVYRSEEMEEKIEKICNGCFFQSRGGNYEKMDCNDTNRLYDSGDADSVR